MSFSIVLPLYNEADNISNVYLEICEILDGNFEVIIVNDGSTDYSLKKINIIKENNDNVIIESLPENLGQSKALLTGIKLANNEKVVIMDSDGQYNPKDIPILLGHLSDKNRLVSGKRDNRKDSFLYRMASHYGNSIIAWFFKLPKFDLGCGLKAGYKKDFLKLPYFKNNHRYYQILYHFKGYKTKTIEIDHRPRVTGKSKYSLLKIFNIIPRIIWLKIKKPGAIK